MPWTSWQTSLTANKSCGKEGWTVRRYCGKRRSIARISAPVWRRENSLSMTDLPCAVSSANWRRPPRILLCCKFSVKCCATLVFCWITSRKQLARRNRKRRMNRLFCNISALWKSGTSCFKHCCGAGSWLENLQKRQNKNAARGLRTALLNENMRYSGALRNFMICPQKAMDAFYWTI